jgi:hypothetical protein
VGAAAVGTQAQGCERVSRADPPTVRGVPYFNWDAPVANRVVRQALSAGPEEDRLYWMARIMREARYDDVWAYVSLAEVLQRHEAVRPLLGRRRAFWDFLIAAWREQGVV